MTSTSEAARRTRVGYLLVLGAAVLWGSSGPFSVTLMDLGATPESLALLRPVLATFALLAFAGLRRSDKGDRQPLSLRTLVLPLAAGGIGVGVFQIAFQFSTESVGVPTTVGLLYLSPAIVVALSGPIVREWPKPATVVLALISVGGVWLMVKGAGTATGSGSVIWGVICGCTFAAYTLFGRVAVPRYGAFDFTLYSTLGGSLFLLAAWGVGVIDVALPPTNSWALLVVFSVLTLSVSALLYFEGLHRVQASHASIIATAEPVVASVLAASLLGQTMEPLGWVGLMLVIGGVASTYALDGAWTGAH